MAKPKNQYQVIISNVGTTHFTNKKEALKAYRAGVEASLVGVGRGSGEKVVLIRNGETILREHTPRDEIVEEMVKEKADGEKTLDEVILDERAKNAQIGPNQGAT